MSPRIPASSTIKKTEAQRKHESRLQERDFQPPVFELDAPAVAIDDEAEAVDALEPEQPEPEPPKVKAPPPPASSLVTAEIEREQRLAEAREELVFRRHALLAEGQDLSAAEYRLLQSGCPRSSQQNDYEYRQAFQEFLAREMNRVQTIFGLKTRAGTPADRAAADKLAEAAERKRDIESPELEQRIRELQEQLSALHFAADTARAAAADRHQAVSELKREHLLPGYVKDEIAAARRVDERSFAGELLRLESRVRALRGLLAVDPESPDGREVVKHHVSVSRRFGNDTIECLKAVFEFSTENLPGGVAHRFGAIRPEVWEEYLAEVNSELAAAERRIAEIGTGPQAEADQKIEAMRSHYIPN